MDLGYSYQNNTVDIFEIRPQWNDRTIKREHKVAKAKYIKSKNKDLLDAFYSAMGGLSATA